MTSSQKSEPTEWLAQSLRVTAFPSPTPYTIDGSWWHRLTGEPPDTSTAEPKKNLVREEGQALGGQLVLVLQAGRIDWVWADNDLGARPFREALDSFVPAMDRWLTEDAPPLQRIAFGTIARLPVPDKVTGYTKLSAYLPQVGIDAEGTSDFHYQINRPRRSKSGIEGLMMNRLSKWSVGLLQQATFSHSQGKGIASFQEAQFHCHLELDFNTSGDFKGEFSIEQRRMILKELVGLTLETLNEGDIP